MKKINTTESAEVRIRKIIREEIEIWWKEMIELAEKPEYNFRPRLSSFNSLPQKCLKNSTFKAKPA